ncbi:MAG: glutathione S-transferase [Halieaceae bacterium]|jgi:glutathione S-transferase
MKLWHCKDARSLRPLWALEEMGLEYELETMPFPPRFFVEGYTDINVLGTIPYLIDGEVRMTESTAICHYLVERYGQDKFGIGVNHPEYGDYLNWLYHSDATLTFPQTLVMRYYHLEPTPEKQAVAQDYAKWYFARLRLLDGHLDGREFLCGDKFTIADIAIGYALYLGRTLELNTIVDRTYSPQVEAYLDRLVARPAFIRASAIDVPK